MLDFYTRHFDTVEINNTFYRLPPETAVKNWRDSTPRDFCFALKGSRFLTHMKKLKDPVPGIQKFMERADLLEKKLEPIVFQFRPGGNCTCRAWKNFWKRCRVPSLCVRTAQ